jgi:imidazole glycerol phosphate synthase glutamine amidotransferase subunit
MKTRTIGIVDYGVGNHASVYRTLRGLGYRCRVTSQTDVLDTVDVLLLPGVGAFPAAMQALNDCGLVEYIQTQARRARPMIGICLGMQLLADTSLEHRLTAGLGLIPGTVAPLSDAAWHIGWNTIEVLHREPLLQPSDGHSLYFNHSYVFEPAAEYRAAVSRLGVAFTVAVRRENIVGLQFHPEKSQVAGRRLLRNIIEGLSRD